MGQKYLNQREHTRTNNSNQQLETTRDRKRQKVKPRTMALLFDTVFDLDDLVFRHPFAPSSCGSKRKQCVPGSMAKRQQWPKIDLLEEEDRFVVKADVPGVPKDKLKLSVSEDGITLGFEEEESKEEGGSQGKALTRTRSQPASWTVCLLYPCPRPLRVSRKPSRSSRQPSPVPCLLKYIR